MGNRNNDIKQQLKSYKKKFYTNELIKGGIFFTASALSAFLIISFVEYIAQFPSLGRLTLLITYLSILTYGVGKWIIWPIYQLLNLDKFLSDEQAALQIGNFFPEISDKLLNTLELSSLHYENNSLILASIKQKSKDFESINFNNAVDQSHNKRHIFRYLVPAFTIIGFVLLFQPSIVANSTERIVNYDNLEYDIPFKFDINDKPEFLLAGDEQKFEISIDGRDGIPSQAFAFVDGQKKLLEKSGNNFYLSLKPTSNRDKIELQFEAAGYRSNIHTFQVYSRPNVEEIKFNVEYPKYTGIRNKIIKNNSQITIPFGTKIKTIIKSNSTDKIYYRTQKKKLNFQEQSKKIFSYNLEIKENENLDLILENENSTNKNKIVHSFNVINDRYPTIQFQEFQDTTLYKYIIFQGALQDDYGISKFNFYYRIKNSNNSYRKSSVKFNKRISSQQFLYEFQLAKLNLQTNDVIEYFFSAFDNDKINGPKEYRTPVSTYKAPSTSDINKQLEEESQKTNEQMSNTKDQSDELNADLERIQKNLKTKKQLTFEDKKEIKELAKDHEKLEKNIEELKKQFDKEQLQNERFNESSPEMQQKIEHLQRLMEELMDNESQELMEKMQQEQNINEMQKNLEELNKSDQELQKELERTLELYKKLKAEQKLEKNIQELEKLAQKQEQLAQENKKGKTEENAAKQEKLNKEFEEFQKEMKEMDKLNNDLKRPMEMENFEQEQNGIKHDMQDAKEQLDQKESGSSKKSQQKAGQKMKGMAAAMKKMQDGMEMEQMMEDLDNLRQILHNLLYLSKEQEYLIKTLRKTQLRNPKFVELSRNQINLNISSKVVEDSLYALASRTFQIEPYITKELGDMKEFMLQSDEAIRARKRPLAVTKQQYAMTSMNNLALLLDEVLDQMQQNIANSKPGQQMCNKPGGPGSKPNLGKMQQQLNQGIKELSQGQKEGRKPSDKIAKMAAQQQQIKDGLTKLQQEGNNSKELAKQIEELKRLMIQTENNLLNKRLNSDLVKRQQQIQVKLLEVEKTAKKQEYDNKRESKSAGDIQAKYPPAFEEYLKSKQNQIELIKTIPPNFTPYYKEEISKYYERIK